MKLKSLILLVVAAPVVLTSCLKSKDSLGITKDPGSISTGIFDRFYYGANKAFVLEGLPAIETLPTFLSIRMSAPKKAAGKVHVVLAVDNSLVTAYNTANGTAFVNLPANAYTIPGLEFDIPAGNSGEYNLPLTLNKNNLNLQNAYAIGFKIVSVSEGVISENEKNIIVSFLVKNKYDGRYTITGTMTDFSNAAFVGCYGGITPANGGPLEWELVTSGPTQCIVFDNIQLGIPGHVFSSLSDPTTPNTYYGSFGLIINFDPSDNIANVVNYYGQPSANGRSANLDPTGINKYNPTTKVVNIKYFMDQPSVIVPHRTLFNETWTYVGPR